MPVDCYGYNPFEREEVKSILFLRYDNATMSSPPRHRLFREEKYPGHKPPEVLDYVWCLDIGVRDPILRCFTHAPDGYRLIASTLWFSKQGHLQYDLERYHGEMGPPGPMGLPCDERGIRREMGELRELILSARTQMNPTQWNFIVSLVLTVPIVYFIDRSEDTRPYSMVAALLLITFYYYYKIYS